MNLNALVFDMDDTLYKEVEYVFSGYQAVDIWVKDNYGITGFYNLATRLFNTGLRAKVFNKSLELLEVNYNENTIAEMVMVYRNHEPVIEMLDDAKWVIDNLINSVKIGLISDGFYKSQENKVKSLRINDKFNAIILTDWFGRENWKPSPYPYIKASKQLNCKHQECVYIGDNLSKDFITAKKLGWKTVHIKRNDGIYSNLQVTSEYKAHYEIQDLRELYSIPELKHMFIIS